jgi:AAA+ ATPase superfamily predicted ATPase
MDLLDRQWQRPDGAFVPVYGRRRVGKTALILEFMRSRRGLYFVGQQGPADLQRRDFLRIAAQALDEPLLADAHFDAWGPLLEAVVDRWRGDGKLVLALDEFQWMAAASPELPSVLQQLWDRSWSRGGVMLILCGSWLGFMEREVLGSRSPLFGRRTAQIPLAPFTFREARQFHPRWSPSECLRARSICGGVAQYLRTFDDRHSVAWNVQNHVLTEFSPLFREPEFLLREELRELANYYAILRELADGQTAASALARRTGLSGGGLSYYVDQLVSLGYVCRRAPLSHERVKRTSKRFALHDPLLRFWFRFVQPNRSYLTQHGPSTTWATRVKPHIEAWYGHAFEVLCREALPALYAAEGIDAGFEVGEYWNRDVQVDVVGLRDDDWIDIGECRWGPVKSRTALWAELRKRMAAFPNPRASTLQGRIFTRLPVDPPDLGPVPLRWHHLDELYAL